MRHHYDNVCVDGGFLVQIGTYQEGVVGKINVF